MSDLHLTGETKVHENVYEKFEVHVKCLSSDLHMRQTQKRMAVEHRSTVTGSCL